MSLSRVTLPRACRLLGTLGLALLLVNCSRSSHHSSDVGPSPNDGQGPADGTGTGGATVTLPETELAVTQPGQPWDLNRIDVDSGAPAQAIATFSYSPNQGSYLQYGREQKETHGCTGGDITYTMTIEDLAGGTPQAIKLQDCIEIPGARNYRLAVTIANPDGCESFSLGIGFLERSGCASE